MKTIKINWSLVDKQIDINIEKARLKRSHKIKKILK